MSSYAVVSNKAELEKALEKGVQEIVITDIGVARNIKIVKATSRAGLAVAIGSALVAAVNFWNPIGWTVGAVEAVSGGAIITALIVLGLGATLIWAIYNKYDVKAGGKVTLPDGTTVEGELILQRK
jgi:hypothetical protein